MLRAGDITSLALTETLLDRIASLNPKLNAYITVTQDLALQQAKAADRDLAAGRDLGPLHGIPVSVKDLFDTKGIRTTSGSRLFADKVPDRDSDVVALLKASGAVILGKTGMYELAAGTTGQNPFFGDISNPWRDGLDPGGSSGGSACAVAAGLAFAAVGTDTGCSIREPAHCCGIVGFKPTFGQVSMHGGQALVPSMDHAGPLARDVNDAAIVFSVLADRAAKMAQDQRFTPDLAQQPKPASVAGTRIGVIRDYFFDADPIVVQAVDDALAKLAAAGAEIIDIEGPDLHAAFKAVEICFDEAAEVHKETLARPDAETLFSPKVFASLTRRLSASKQPYQDAQVFRQAFRVEMQSCFDTVDMLAAPTCRRLPLNLAEVTPDYERAVWQNTSIFNFTGQPSISLPCAKGQDGHLVGLMLSAARNQDADLLNQAAAIEACLGNHDHHPEL